MVQVELSSVVLNPADSGLEVLDLRDDPAFARRRLHSRDVATQMEGMRRLTHAFVESPDTILQELVNAAVDLCGADSAGISIEREDKTDESYYHWVATAGNYERFLNATLPRSPSACGVCLERGRPQLFRVSQRFFDLMGIEAPTVTDGILLPWQVEEMRGTIWIMAHERTEAFDGEDLRMMQVLADFAAMANELAHQINNPLQSLTNLVYLASEGRSGGDAKMLGEELSEHIQRLSVLVKELLALPAHTVGSE
jgi:hypothetical protein